MWGRELIGSVTAFISTCDSLSPPLNRKLYKLYMMSDSDFLPSTSSWQIGGSLLQVQGLLTYWVYEGKQVTEGLSLKPAISKISRLYNSGSDCGVRTISPLVFVEWLDWGSHTQLSMCFPNRLECCPGALSSFWPHLFIQPDWEVQAWVTWT